MREFIASDRGRAIESHGEIPADSELARWLAWAEARANAADPVTNGEPFT